MVAYGMGDTIGIYKQDKKQVEKLLREALVATEKLLKPKKKIIRQVADLLIEKGTVAGNEIYAIVEGKS
jgi:ATP-dependent Zn protease